MNLDYLKVEEVWIAIECSNLQIESEEESKSSLFSYTLRNIKNAALRGLDRHNQRFVRISISEPGPLGVSPLSLKYEEIFCSEIIVDNEVPRFVMPAHITCPANKDLKVQLVVIYISSEIRSGREEVLGTTSFSFRELVRSTSRSAPFTTNLSSTMSPNAGVSLYRLHLPEEVPLQNSILNSSSAPKPFNPMTKRYVMWRGESPTSSESSLRNLGPIWCEERTLEPRLCMKIPCEMIQLTTKAMLDACAAWSTRLEHERVRQGSFQSIHEAFQFRHVRVKVGILEGRNLISPLELTLLTSSSNLSTDSSSPNSSSVQLVDRHTISSTNQQNDENENEIPKQLLQSSISFKHPPSNRPQSDEPISTSHHQRHVSAQSLDPTTPKPNPIVTLSLSKPTLTFAKIIGETNVEHNASNPKFGTNLDTSGSRSSHIFTSHGYSEVIDPIPGYSAPQLSFFFPFDDLSAASLNFKVSHVENQERREEMGKCSIKLSDLQESNEGIWIPLIGKDDMVNGNMGQEGEKEEEEGMLGELLVVVTIEGFNKMQSFFEPSSEQEIEETENENESKEEEEEEEEEEEISIINERRETLKKEWKDSMVVSQLDLVDNKLTGGHDILSRCYRWMRTIGYLGHDPLAAVDAHLEHIGRVDVPLPIHWLTSHVATMERDTIQLAQLMTLYEDWFLTGRSFRGSQMKKQWNYQGIPVNLHIQLFSVREHPSDPNSIIHTHDMITSGASTVHAMGFKGGKGLDQLERDLSKKKRAIDGMKDVFFEQVRYLKSGSLPSEHMKPYHTLRQITSAVTDFETKLLDVCIRRIFVRSQILTTALTCLLTKLEMIMEGNVPGGISQFWIDSGFPIVFEGLLSTNGKERGMIEDVVVGVEMLNTMKVEFIEKDMSRSINQNHKDDEGEGGKEEEKERFTLKRISSSPEEFMSYSENLPPRDSTMNSGKEEEEEEVDTDEEDNGKEEEEWDLLHEEAPIVEREDVLKGASITMKDPTVVLLHLPPQAFQALPAFLSPGAQVPFMACLFTQGIDVKQSLSNTIIPNTMSEERLDGPYYQHQINLKSFKRINKYAHKARPAKLRSKAEKLKRRDFIESSSFDEKSSKSLDSSILGGSLDGRSSSVGSDLASRLKDEERKRDTISIPSDFDVLEAARHISMKRPNSRESSSSQQSNTQDDEDLSLQTHPILQRMEECIDPTRVHEKNVQILMECERVSEMLSTSHVTFCKSGKDRTGMAVTLQQSRLLGERFAGGMTDERILRDATTMRLLGTRRTVCEKNIGRPTFSINKIQIPFMPPLYRPPVETSEELIRSTITKNLT